MRLVTLSIAILISFLTPASSKATTIDTVKNEEISKLMTGFKSSPIYAYYMVDSCSKNNDSTGASYWLQKVSPYYLIWEWRNSTRPDSFLAKLNLTEPARKNCEAAYKHAMKSKSETYKAFEAMAEEDQRIRYMREKCGDTFTCRKMYQRMRWTDSTHFAFLYDYVKENGWPSVEDGSMGATLLAIHDHARHGIYISHLKRAVKSGKADIAALRLINYFLIHQSSDTRAIVKKKLETNKHYKFDISAILNDKLPASLPRIQKVFEESCSRPFRFYYWYEAPNSQGMGEWVGMHNRPDGIMERFQLALRLYCNDKIFAPEVWTFNWIPSDRVKLTMIVLYEEPW